MSMIQVSEELVAQFLGSKTRRSDAYIRRSRGISRNVLPSILLLTVYDTRYSGHDMPPFACIGQGSLAAHTGTGMRHRLRATVLFLYSQLGCEIRNGQRMTGTGFLSRTPPWRKSDDAPIRANGFLSPGGASSLLYPYALEGILLARVYPQLGSHPAPWMSAQLRAYWKDAGHTRCRERKGG